MHSTQTLIVAVVVSVVITLVLAVGGLAAFQTTHHQAVPSPYVAPPVVQAGESPETACIARGGSWAPGLATAGDPAWNGSCYG